MATPKKILTVEDLLNFCETQQFMKFSSKDTGYQLAVKVPTTFEEVENVDENHRGMLKLKFRIFHTNLNRNGSFVSKEAATKAMDTISDRPILAAIHQLDDGSWDFEGHEMEIIENENGETETKYIESQVGSFSSEPAFWEHDDELDKDYVCAYGYIPRDYTKAAEIIESKNGTKNSCELCIDELAYNAKEKYLDLIDFYVNASTLLGKRNDGTEIGEGMLGSRADIADFSTENNSVKFEQNNKLIETLEKLNTTLSNFNINTNFTKGGTNKEMNKFEELMEKYNKTIEDITFEYEGLTDEELEVAFTEAFETSKKKIEDDDNNPSSKDKEETPDVEDVNPSESEPIPTPEPEPTEPETPDDNNETDVDGGDTDPSINSLQYSVEIGELKKDFSLSLSDKQFAIYCLINDTYGEQDNDFYDVDVYEDDKSIVMHGWYSGKHYRQSYKVKGDVYSLKGDRIEVFTQYLTTDEIAKLDSMKANYSSVSEKLAKYESEPEKMEILLSEDYSQIADSEDFKTFMVQENHFDLTVEEVKEKADKMLLDFAKSGNLKFAKEETPIVASKQIVSINKKSSRYGTLFAKN